MYVRIFKVCYGIILNCSSAPITTTKPFDKHLEVPVTKYLILDYSYIFSPNNLLVNANNVPNLFHEMNGAIL